jgi:transposase
MKTINSQNIDVVVDTGKQQLDIYIRPLDIFFTVENNEQGITKAITEINKQSLERIIIEATGRLELLFVMASAKANFPFVVTNPIHVRRFMIFPELLILFLHRKRSKVKVL